jgi:hypothetical protein
MLTKKVFLAAKAKKVKLADMNADEARYAGKSLSKSLSDTSEPARGVYRWMRKNLAMKELDDT